MTKFECSDNYIVGLPQPFHLDFFIFGLSPDICREVKALWPFSLTQATTLTKLQEDKIKYIILSSNTKLNP